MELIKIIDKFKSDDPTIRLAQVCFAVAFITFFARLPFVVEPGLSIDSYFYVRGFPTLEQLLGQGRFGQYLVLKGGELLGFNMLAFGSLMQGVGLIFFAFSTPLIFTAFDRTGDWSAVGLILSSLLVTLHPYSAEILTFSEASFTAQLATGLGIGGFFIVARRVRLWWVGVVMLVMALSMYQLLLNYIALMLLFGFIQISIRDIHGPLMDFNRYRDLAGPILMSVTGVIAYMVIYKLVLAAFGLEETGRSEFLPLDMVDSRIDEMSKLTKFLWDRPYLVDGAPLASAIMWITAIAGWIVFFAWVLFKAPRRACLIFLIAALIPFAGIGVVAVGKTWWPVPRVLGGVVVAWAMGYFWLFKVLRGRRQLWLMSLPVVLSLLGAAAVGHRIHGDQMLVNGYDRVLAAAIYTSLNEHSDFSDETRIAIVNRHMQWAHPFPLPTMYMDMNLTAFALTGAQQGVLRITTGHELITIEPRAEHFEVCDSLPAWPKAGFTSIISSGEAVVCL